MSVVVVDDQMHFELGGGISLPIRRRMWVFVDTKKMIEDEWAKRNDYVGSELF